MSIFIDTGIFIAYINKLDKHYGAASALMEDIMKNKYGMAFTSGLVFTEAMTFVLYKTRDENKIISMKDLILGNKEKDIPQFINILFMDREVLDKTWDIFIRYAAKKLSFTDCSIIEMMRNRDIEHIASFDGGFDGIVSRLEY